MPTSIATPRVSAAIPRDNIDVRLARQLVGEGPLPEVPHIVLATFIGFLLWRGTSHGEVLAWAGSIIVAAAIRGMLRWRAARSPSVIGAIPSLRIGTLLVTLAWGVGLFLIGPTLGVEPLALIMVMIAGIVSGTIMTLLADPASFGIMLIGLLAPLLAVIQLNPHFHALVGVVMLIIYGLAIIVFYRRSHAALLDRLTTAIRLEQATAEATAAGDAERTLSRIIEATTDYVGIAGPDGQMHYLNRAGREMIGIGATEDITKYNVMDLTPPRLHEWAVTTLQPEANRIGSWAGETALQHRNGREVPVSLVALVHKDENGAVDSVSAIARDASRETAARAALQAARDTAEQATAAKSAFLANTSHEIRTPLNGILGMVELLLDTDLSASQRRSVEVIASSGDTLLHTINDLLDFSKIEAGQLDLEVIPFDLHQLVNSTVRLFMPRANAKEIELACDIQPGVPQHVRGDPHRLRQVLGNLLSNAVKFTEKGEVVLTARTESTAEEPSIAFGVRDTGIGIRAEQLPRVFEAFRQADVSTTRRYGGTGLGLSIAKRLVELMGGDLRVLSKEGRGSEFRFSLSLPRASEIAELRPERSLNDVRVLVVDDHPTNRRILSDMFRWAGADVQTAAGASDALDRLHGAVARGSPYRLLVSDVQMPARDGFGLAADIRASPPLRETRVMLLTSAGEAGDVERSRGMGVTAYLQKPVSRVELIDAALAALGSSATMARPLVTRSSIEETRQRLRVLLAEDNPVNTEVAVAMLRKRGHGVAVAANGREAVEAIARGDRFDVVLMDLQMPELDGIEATQMIRGMNGTRLPIIAVTANTSPGERERCLAAGMDGYLAKPFKAHELFAVVEGWSPREPPSGANPIPPVDLQGFREMLSNAGLPDTADRMLAIFLSDTPARVADMADAAQRGDLQTVQAITHRLKSSSAAIRATDLSDLLSRAESSAQAEDSPSALTAVRAAESEYERVVAYLKAQLQRA